MPRRICFVTGTRAEFGLMGSVLEAIRARGGSELQIIATGMHLDASRGGTLKAIEADGWKIDAAVPWKKANSPESLAVATGRAMADIAACIVRLRSDVVLVVGDRVEAFAAAAGGAISGKAVAHVHGGDRALGQVDDSLRHAITKLAHVHFPATRQSAARIARLGEDKWRIHHVGSPGIDRIINSAAAWPDLFRYTGGLLPRSFAVLVYHPVDQNEKTEQYRAEVLLAATLKAGVQKVAIIYPNTDPGAGGIVRAWRRAAGDDRCVVLRNLPRPIFLGLLRDAAMLVGNSSSGIIEAASFKTPVIDVGPRQLGRECARDVIHTSYDFNAIKRGVARVWNNGHPVRAKASNPYAATDDKQGAGAKIADILGRLTIDRDLLSKLIAY